jgi:hypothetical protein
MSENVQGPWTIQGTGNEIIGKQNVTVDGPQLPIGRRVPVVPCDEAAVERAAKAIREADVRGARDVDIARAALRAAGAVES